MNMKMIKTGLVVFMILALGIPEGFAQDNNLSESYEKSLDSFGSSPMKDRATPTDDNVEMLRQALTIRGADNQLFQLEYFFPQLVSPVPFTFTGNSTNTAPKDYATSVVIPDAQNSNANSGFDGIPSVDGLVKNSEPANQQGNKNQNQQGNQNQNRNQNRNQNKNGK